MMLSYAKSYPFNRCETSAVAGTFVRMNEILGTVLLAVSVVVVVRLLVLQIMSK